MRKRDTREAKRCVQVLVSVCVGERAPRRPLDSAPKTCTCSPCMPGVAQAQRPRRATAGRTAAERHSKRPNTNQHPHHKKKGGSPVRRMPWRRKHGGRGLWVCVDLVQLYAHIDRTPEPPKERSYLVVPKDTNHAYNRIASVNQRVMPSWVAGMPRHPHEWAAVWRKRQRQWSKSGLGVRNTRTQTRREP